MDTSTLEELAKRLTASLPAEVKALRHDVEANFKAVLQSGLAKLDLVTRREFEVQAGVLKRTREKLEVLEQKLAQFEAEFSHKTPRS
jgi:BMFP domain-containing protein YqiC